MSINIPTHFVQQYSTNIQLLLQQLESRFTRAVMSGTHLGKQASPVDQFGAIDMQAVTGRFEPIGRVDAPTDRRWVFPSDFDLPQLLDSFDELRLLTDPKSSYVRNAVAAANRRRDDSIIAAFFGDAKTGEEGGTTTVFPAANQIAVNFAAAGDVGMTVAKLREGKKKLMAAEVDLETDPLFCSVTATQHDDLLAEAQIISTDFNDKPVLVEGKITRFLGINFIHSERLDVDGSADSRCPLWAQSGMYLGMWNNMRTDVSQRKDLKGHPWQAYLYMTIGATRLEEDKTIEIKCGE